ncbi:hypothetical protein [Urechidicola croceus]|uniref:Lipocalin-like domain-containing protein n=1 Tax=Urechidicola croceus TaxID=1850246 RepID=A0A1D8P4X2_9FLAO|nr:hypothetical protein [Urechidicola croceus]AOW19623.1 hypothetical protein LPB138_02535 [Urechidicola croceus]
MKLKIIIASLLLFSLSKIPTDLKTDLIGTWEDSRLKITYEFRENGSVFFNQNDTGVFVQEYIIDDSKSPIWIDFQIQGMKIPGLLKVIDENTIWIEQFPPYPNHPTKFSEDETMASMHILKRK